MKDLHTRDSGIELLRIIAACMVIMLHYNDGRAFNYYVSSEQKIILFLLESACICTVDLFVLISGYYLCKNNERTLLKPFKLYLQVVLFSEAYYLTTVVYKYFFEGMFELSIKHIISKLLLSSYFVVLYIVLYFVSPYINIVLAKLDRKQQNILLFTIITIFSVYAVATDFLQEILDTEFIGISPVTAWGNKQGFNIVNFVLVYIIGAYIRYWQEEFKVLSNKRVLLFAWIVDILLIFGWSLINDLFSHHGLRSAWVYHNPLVILSAVLLFLLFDKLDIHSQLINELSRASFTCFVFHGYVIGNIGIKQVCSTGDVWMMLLQIVVCIIVIYLVSLLLCQEIVQIKMVSSIS